MTIQCNVIMECIFLLYRTLLRYSMKLEWVWRFDGIDSVSVNFLIFTAVLWLCNSMSWCGGKSHSNIKGDGALCWQITLRWFRKRSSLCYSWKKKHIRGLHSVESNCRSMAYRKDKARKLRISKYPSVRLGSGWRGKHGLHSQILHIYFTHTTQ